MAARLVDGFSPMNALQAVNAFAQVRNRATFSQKMSTLDERLQTAAKNGDSTLCRSLIAARANPNAKNDEGNSPLDNAISKGHWLAAQALRRNGAEINPKSAQILQKHFAAHENPELSAMLHQEIDKGTNVNPTLCSLLIAQKANPNIRSATGKTLIDKAIDERQWPILKVLIDHGAVLTPSNREDLHKFLSQKGLQENGGRETFMLPFPHVNEIELFVDGAFHPLSETTRKQQQSCRLPLALYSIGDEGPTSNYGFSANIYSNKYYPKIPFQGLAHYFTLVRTRVDNAQKLHKSIVNVKRIFDKLPLRLWHLDMHANSEILACSQSSFLHKSETDLIQSLVTQVDEPGVIILNGCSCAEGVDNIATEFSKNSANRIVYATPNPAIATILFVFYLPDSTLPIILPFFKNNDPIPYTRAYKNGTLIAEGERKDRDSIEKKLRQSLLPSATPSPPSRL